MAITRSVVSAFPLLATASTGTTLSIASVKLGSTGDIVLITLVYSDNLGLSVPPTVTATGLTFVHDFDYDAVGDFNQYSYLHATIPAAAAGTTVTVTATFSSGSMSGGFGAMGVDDLASGLGANTVWTFGTGGGIVNTSSLTITYPSLTMPATGTPLYYGCASGNDNGTLTTPVNGATFIGDVPTDIVFSTNAVVSTAYQPTWSQTPAAVSDAASVTYSAAVPGTSKGFFLVL